MALWCRWLRGGVVLSAFCVSYLLLLQSGAEAQDLTTSLSEAESRVEVAASELREREAAISPGKERFEASAQRAAPATAAAHAANHRVAEIEGQLRNRHLAAQAKVSRVDAEKRDAADKRDETVRFGLGVALAALIAAGLALAWDWFRASSPVAWLTRMPLGQAVGLCAGGGLLIVIVGAAMSGADGIAGVVGVTLFLLGFVLANAMVLARHSVEVQRGRSKPILHRERLPRRVAQAIAGVFVALCLIAFGTAVFAGESDSGEASASLRREAVEWDASAAALVSAEATAAQLERNAAPLVAATHVDQHALREAHRKLGHAKRQLRRAENDADSLTHRLVVLEGRERRQAETEARRAEQRAARETEELEELAAEECNPNYSGCLDPSASDYDCEGGSGDGPLYTGTVEVIGYDEYGLDADSDGVGCE